MLVGIMQSRIRRLALLLPLLLAWAGVAGAIERQGEAAGPGVTMSFHTLDGDVQQVRVDEIWRVREAAGVEEPAGAIVVDYAFERLFVKDPLDGIVDDIRKHRKFEKFTSPSGAPVYFAAEKVIGISRAMPNQHHPKSKSIIIAREGQQQVQESRETVQQALGK